MTITHIPVPVEDRDAMRRPILVHTLGGIRVVVEGQEARWDEVHISQKSLRRMLAYLVIYRDRLVSRYRLNQIGATQGIPRRYLAVGIGTLLRRWGFGRALITDKETIRLIKHPTWRLDTEELTDFKNQADSALAVGQIRIAYERLACAERYCTGAYMDGCESVDDAIDADCTYWFYYQYEVVTQFAHLCLRIGEQHAYQQGCQALDRVIRLLGVPTPSDLRLLATLYERRGLTRLAADFRRKADDLDDADGGDPKETDE